MLNEDELREAALLVFANKQDQPGAKGAGDISEALRLGQLKDRNWSIVACSAVDGKGVDEGMDWLVVSCSLELCLEYSARLKFVASKPSIRNHDKTDQRQQQAKVWLHCRHLQVETKDYHLSQTRARVYDLHRPERSEDCGCRQDCEGVGPAIQSDFQRPATSASEGSVLSTDHLRICRASRIESLRGIAGRESQ